MRRAAHTTRTEQLRGARAHVTVNAPLLQAQEVWGARRDCAGRVAKDGVVHVVPHTVHLREALATQRALEQL